LEKLEWAWNMDYKTLDVDTRENLQPLQVALGALFDRNKNTRPTGWFWYPEDVKIVEKMHKVYVDEHVYPLTVVPKGKTLNARCHPSEFYGNMTSFKYRFYPLPNMVKSVNVIRLEDPSADLEAEPRVVQHWYDFQTLGTLDLHIPYHFVIVNTGQKLHGLFGRREITYEMLRGIFPWVNTKEMDNLLAIRAI
ncbi:hypothetical protein C8Q76DRAFT_635452, partial [Earliella scabrosa]